MANVNFNRGKLIVGGTTGWLSGSTYRLLLATVTYTPLTTHNVVSDVTNELSGGGYARKDITNRSQVEDDANNRADYKADNVSWTGLTSTQSFRWVVVYKFGTVDADSDLICALDMTVDIGFTGLTDFTLKWDNQAANGRVFSIT